MTQETWAKIEAFARTGANGKTTADAMQTAEAVGTLVHEVVHWADRFGHDKQEYAAAENAALREGVSFRDGSRLHVPQGPATRDQRAIADDYVSEAVAGAVGVRVTSALAAKFLLARGVVTEAQVLAAAPGLNGTGKRAWVFGYLNAGKPHPGGGTVQKASAGTEAITPMSSAARALTEKLSRVSFP